jgi:hypothetical protein
VELPMDPISGRCACGRKKLNTEFAELHIGAKS